MSTPTVAPSASPPAPLPVAPCHRRAVERVIQAVSERLDESYSLSDLAAIAYLSPYHFHRVFRHATGVPPGRFLAALRMEAAKRLLLTSDLSVTETCFAVGYHSLGTFTSQFSRLVGLSPGALRRLARGNGGNLAPLPELGADDTAVVKGELHAGGGFHGLAFVGLFPTPLPEGAPSGCTVAAVPGPYTVGACREGSFHLLAAAFPNAFDLVGYLIPDSAALVGRSAGPVLVRTGRDVAGVDIVLRPRRLTDPPILIAPTALFARPAGRASAEKTSAPASA